VHRHGLLSWTVCSVHDSTTPHASTDDGHSKHQACAGPRNNQQQWIQEIIPKECIRASTHFGRLTAFNQLGPSAAHFVFAQSLLCCACEAWREHTWNGASSSEHGASLFVWLSAFRVCLSSQASRTRTTRVPGQGSPGVWCALTSWQPFPDARRNIAGWLSNWKQHTHAAEESLYCALNGTCCRNCRAVPTFPRHSSASVACWSLSIRLSLPACLILTILRQINLCPCLPCIFPFCSARPSLLWQPVISIIRHARARLDGENFHPFLRASVSSYPVEL
jgi:hypothetical protein